MAALCPRCRTPLRLKARFCHQCGQGTELVGPRRGRAAILGWVALTLGVCLFVFARFSTSRGPGDDPPLVRGTVATRSVPARLIDPGGNPFPDVIDAELGDLELADSPRPLNPLRYPATALRLHGARLGDSSSKLPPYTHLVPGSPHASGGGSAYDLPGGNAYDVRADGRVSRIVLDDPRWLSKIGARGAEEIRAWFGEPEAASAGDDPTPKAYYAYPSLGVTVRWDRRSGRVDRIELAPPTSAASAR